MLIIKRRREGRDADLLDDVASGIAHGLVEQVTETVSTEEQPPTASPEPSFLERLTALIAGGPIAAGAMAGQAIANNPAVAGATVIGEAIGIVIPPIVEIARRVRIPSQIAAPTWPNRQPPARTPLLDQADPVLQPTPEYTVPPETSLTPNVE